MEFSGYDFRYNEWCYQRHFIFNQVLDSSKVFQPLLILRFCFLDFVFVLQDLALLASLLLL